MALSIVIVKIIFNDYFPQMAYFLWIPTATSSSDEKIVRIVMMRRSFRFRVFKKWEELGRALNTNDSSFIIACIARFQTLGLIWTSSLLCSTVVYKTNQGLMVTI